MLAIASQIILCLVLAALLGLIIGYLFGRSSCPKNIYKSGTVHDPHTTDDGDCNDAEETDRSDTADSENIAEETDAASESEIQGLMQDVEGSSRESESAERETSESETAPAAHEEEAAASNETIPEKTEEKAAKADQTDSRTETEEKEDAEAPSDDDKPDSLLKAPRNGEKDNLTRIKGIGIKIEALLNGIGVFHFDQIAAWTDKEARWIDHQVSFPGRAFRDDWIGQAKLLAEGKETEFSRRVDAGEVSSSHKS